MKSIWLALLACGLLPALAHAERLPTTVVPEHYDLAFTPDLEAETFEGRARIRVHIASPSRSIVLHAVDLTIRDARVETADAAIGATVRADQDAQQITLELPAPVSGTATLDLRFDGTLNEQLRGFYISRTERRKYAASQFQVADARRAFPSFDEPAFKATFDVTLTIDEGDMAISNGKVVSDSPGPQAGKHTVTFATTARMSTYLVAVAVGDFKCLETGVEGIPVRVCAVPEKVELGAFGLAAIEQVLPYFNRYYGIPYPFEKLDVVALPDFSAGAMENTGAIFYRESYLLVDERRATTSALKFIAFVMAHEVAHQWFGNLVTLEWWNDIWLNEGFANWAAVKAVEGWRGWSYARENAEEALTAMAVDSLASTRQIRTDVQGLREIEEAFDALTYDKAASVLRMIEHYLGEEPFRLAVARYLERFSYRNATAEDFWRTLAETSGRPVDRLMASFIEQPGVPQIDVRGECRGGGVDVRLAQQRFLLGRRHAAAPAQALWTVPVCVEAGGDVDGACELLTGAEGRFRLPGCAPWLHGNDDAVGYYRVSYDEDAISAMVRSEFAGLSGVELLSLEADVWSTVQIGLTDVASYLQLSEAFLRAPAGRDAAKALTERLRYLSDWIVADEDRARLQDWTRRTLQPIASELGWTPAPDETEETRQLRAAVIRLLGEVGEDPAVLRRAHDIVRADLTGAGAAHPSLATTVYELAAFAGDEALYERIAKSLPSAASPAELYRRQDALARFRRPALIDRAFEHALSSDMRSQDAPAFLGKLLASPAASRQVWTAIKNRWAEVAEKANISRGTLQILRGIHFCDGDAAADVRQFFERHPVPGAVRALAGAVERIEICAAIRDAQQDRLAGALRQR